MIDVNTMNRFNLRQRAQVVKANATELSAPQQFDFEGIKINVDSATNLDHLMRDYRNARLLGRNTIGPDCQEVLIPADISALETAQVERAAALNAARSAELLAQRERPRVKGR
jgi:hypothetical protein